MLTESLSYEYFRLFMLLMQCSEASWSKAMSDLDQMDQFSSYNVILVMFEMSLFNEEVIKRAKSGPVMSHRQAIFQYLRQFVDSTRASDSSNDGDGKAVISTESSSDYKLREQLRRTVVDSELSEEKAFEQFKTRLLYAMMFYSFEIQNDMPLSVTIYHQLQSILN